MSSPAARAVAQEVMAEVGKGRRPILRKIARKHGYSQHVADSPKKITKTKAYQEVLAPLVVRLEKERDAVIERLEKTRSKAKYRDLIDGLDKLTKNLQLLTGGATQNIAIKPIYAGRSVETLPKHNGDKTNLPTHTED